MKDPGSAPIPQKHPNMCSHYRLVCDPARVTVAVRSYRYEEGVGTKGSPLLIDFLPEDPGNPMNFSKSKKWLITILHAIATLAVAFASTAYAGGLTSIILDFKVSTNVAILGVSMFVLGFAIGPLFWAPLSELYGRQKTFIVSYMAFTAFNAGAAGAPNMATLVVLRFLAGCFGSSPLANAAGSIADLFSAEDRGIAAAGFAMAPFLGPTIGPIAGGFLGQYEDWRWVQGMIAAFTGVVWIINSLVIPETYGPYILRRRAAVLSQKSVRAYKPKIDADNPPESSVAQFKRALLRPWTMLFKELIVFLTSIYIAVIYGTLYLCFAAFPIVFQQGRGWSPGTGGLAFIGIAVGMLFAVAGTVLDQKRYLRATRAAGGNAPPEARLPPALVGSVLIPVGLFWFAWTSGSDIHWVVCIIGSAIFSCGLVLVFLSLLTYLVDTYPIHAASVLAANSILRSLFGAAFPLFTTDMYNGLGSRWASSVPGFLAVACIPFPFLFYKYGKRIRSRSKSTGESSCLPGPAYSMHAVDGQTSDARYMTRRWVTEVTYKGTA